MKYRVLELNDYENLIALWKNSEGISIRDADSKEGIKKYLLRNPGLSFVADINQKIVGSIMSGHDGKRGYVQHLAVAIDYRKHGVATTLLNLCMAALEKEGIIKSHIHILCSNEPGKLYWKNRGWIERKDIDVFSFISSNDVNA